MSQSPLSRRQFVQLSAGSAAAALLGATPLLGSETSRTTVKPIKGSWISVLWDDRRHFYWNEACRKFTAAQWRASVAEVADLGMEYLVLLAIAKGGKSFYDSKILPKAEMACEDPIGEMLSEADKRGVKFFISSDWYGEWDHKVLTDPETVAKRFTMMDEVAERYADHKSFYGWYWPNEACLTPYFTQPFMKYVNASSAHAKKLTPRPRPSPPLTGRSVACATTNSFANLKSSTSTSSPIKTKSAASAWTPPEAKRPLPGFAKPTTRFRKEPSGPTSRHSPGKAPKTSRHPHSSRLPSNVSSPNSPPSPPTSTRFSSTNIRASSAPLKAKPQAIIPRLSDYTETIGVAGKASPGVFANQRMKDERGTSMPSLVHFVQPHFPVFKRPRISIPSVRGSMRFRWTAVGPSARWDQNQRGLGHTAPNRISGRGCNPNQLDFMVPSGGQDLLVGPIGSMGPEPAWTRPHRPAPN